MNSEFVTEQRQKYEKTTPVTETIHIIRNL